MCIRDSRHFQCARRVDALKLWLAWRVHGDVGFADRIDHAVAMADLARERIADSGGEFEIVVAGDFTNVVFVWKPPDLRGIPIDELSTEQREQLHQTPAPIKARLQQTGAAMLGYQPVDGLNTFRLLFMNPAVEPGDIEATLAAIAQAGTELVESR